MKFKDIIYYLLILVVIATCVYLVFYMRTESAECLRQPLEYLMAKTGDQCWCLTP